MAGNSASRTVSYSVPWALAGSLSPFTDDTATTSGSTLPLKFRVSNATGQRVGTLRPVLHLARWVDGAWSSEFKPTSTSAPKDGVTFRYDAKANQYTYDLNTAVLARGTYRLRIALGGGAELFGHLVKTVKKG